MGVGTLRRSWRIGRVLPHPSFRDDSPRRVRRACFQPLSTSGEFHVKDNVSRQTYPFNLPDLPYAYDALEPHIDGNTLRIHHHEHHGTYVKKLNEALSGTAQLQKLTLAELLSDTDKLPAEIRAAVKNNGGGHFNHDLFWRSMTPPTSREPRGELATALEQDFWLCRSVSHEVQRHRRQTFREWMGRARACARDEKTRHRRTQGSRGGARSRCNRDLHPRCLGARVLREVPESPPGIHHGFLENRRLGAGRGEVLSLQRSLGGVGYF